MFEKHHHHKHTPDYYHKSLIKIAYHVDAFRLIPRFLVCGYAVLFWDVIFWFIDLPNPSIVQGTFVSTLVGLAGTLFAFYAKTGRNPVLPNDDVIEPIVPIQPIVLPSAIPCAPAPPPGG